ncbi:hypothetical protein HID58_057843, partial [Brassica napus]
AKAANPWTHHLVSDILRSIPRFFFISPPSIGRQNGFHHRSPLKQRNLREESVRRRLEVLVLGPGGYMDPKKASLGLQKATDCRDMACLFTKGNDFQGLWESFDGGRSVVTMASITCLMKCLGEEGFVKEAFYRMKEYHCKPDDVYAYNTIINALCRVGNFKKARFLLDQMQLPITVDMGCRKAIRRRMWEANRMFREMLFRVFAPDVKRECVPNSVTNEIERGVEMMSMMGHGVPGSSTNTPLIHALVETRRVAEARGDGGGRLVLDALTSEGMMVHKRMRQGIDQRYRSAMEIKPSSHPNKGSLVKSLREAATTLSQIEQPLVTETVSKKQALKLLEAELKPLKKSIIKHDLLKNLTVCVSESFRILAPEPPFEDKYLRDIFNLFLAEFSDTVSPYFSRRAKILKTGALSTEFSSSEEC